MTRTPFTRASSEQVSSNLIIICIVLVSMCPMQTSSFTILRCRLKRWCEIGFVKPGDCSLFNFGNYAIHCLMFQIIFNIPKLSADIPSWVSPTHQPLETKSLSGSPVQPTAGLKFKSAMMNANRKNPTTAYTISQWMQEIKMEDEDDEIMTSQLTSKYGQYMML